MFKIGLITFFALLTIKLFGMESYCATVKIEIKQEMTFTRQGFEASMIINNGLSDPLKNINIDIEIVDNDGNPVDDALFFITAPQKSNMTGDVSGTGVIEGEKSANIKWMIIPSADAGGDSGLRYYVGATLTYESLGQESIVRVNRDSIFVKPQPLLKLDYFQPDMVYGDDPFTSQTEPPIPYELGVRIKNIGGSAVNNVRIASAQPKIIENEKRLLVDFLILGSEINGVEAPNELTIDFGEIEPDHAKNARWNMISTVTGQFIDFTISFSHSEELGGEQTSLISEITPHFLIKGVRSDLSGRDPYLDFLAFEGIQKDGKIFLYESDGLEQEVFIIDGLMLSIDKQPSTVEDTIELTFDPPEKTVYPLIYLKIDDPAQGKFPIDRVIRSDGKALPAENCWVERRYDFDTRKYYHLFHLFDTLTTGSYKVIYNTKGITDNTAPVTSVLMKAPYVSVETNYYAVTSSTGILFLTEDISPISKFEMNILEDGSEGFIPVINPFSFEKRPYLGEGLYQIQVYARDTAGNEESPKTIKFLLDNSAPVISDVSSSTDKIYPEAWHLPAMQQIMVNYLVTDAISSGKITFEVSNTVDFKAILYKNEGQYNSGVVGSVSWSGAVQGNQLPYGDYFYRLKAEDGLGHVTYSEVKTVKLSSYLNEEIVSDVPQASQMNPDIHGDMIVWQDNRGGKWDIFLKNGDQEEVNLTSALDGDHLEPKISDQYVIWRSVKTGNIHIYSISAQTYSAIIRNGDQINYSIEGELVAFEDSSVITSNIFLYNIATQEMKQVAGDDLRQHHPVLQEGVITWVDERTGTPEIYQYTIQSEVEARITSDNTIVEEFPQQLDGQTLYYAGKDLYLVKSGGELQQISYDGKPKQGITGEGSLFLYSAQQATGDYDLVKGALTSGLSQRLMKRDGDQVKPAISGKKIVWQDNRNGYWQIYKGEVDLPEMTIKLVEGFNFIAFPESMFPVDGLASTLLTDLSTSVNAYQLMQYDTALKEYKTISIDNGVISGVDFTLNPLEGLFLYTTQNAPLIIEQSSGGTLDLKAGLNLIGLENVPYGLTAAGLVEKLGGLKVKRVRCYSLKTGRYQSLIVKQAGAVWSTLGEDFLLTPGEGIFVELYEDINSFHF